MHLSIMDKDKCKICGVDDGSEGMDGKFCIMSLNLLTPEMLQIVSLCSASQAAQYLASTGCLDDLLPIEHFPSANCDNVIT